MPVDAVDNATALADHQQRRGSDMGTTPSRCWSMLSLLLIDRLQQGLDVWVFFLGLKCLIE